MGNNINVPYSGFINGGVRDGTDVVINGRPNHNFDSFSVNLCSGPTIESGDVALHFNPRFRNGTVVRNHKQGGWGAEETAGGMPFRPGHVFTIHMEVKSHGYKVLVNNRHFCDFTHRMAKETVQYLFITGDVTIYYINFKGQTGTSHPPGSGYPTGPVPPAYPPAPSYPSGPAGGVPYPGGAPQYPTGPVPPAYPPAPTPGFPPAPSYPSGPAGGVPYPGGAPPFPGAPAGPIFNPMVPVNIPIQGGFHPGKIIYITGSPRHGASRFQVNLACGYLEISDLALHFDARFNFGDCRNVVVRTHRQNGQFGNEERHASYFPFIPGANFEMMLLCEPQAIKVAVNGSHFVEFMHRIQPIQRIDHVQVQGDVTITQIRFQ